MQDFFPQPFDRKFVLELLGSMQRANIVCHQSNIKYKKQFIYQIKRM